MIMFSVATLYLLQFQQTKWGSHSETTKRDPETFNW